MRPISFGVRDPLAESDDAPDGDDAADADAADWDAPSSVPDAPPDTATAGAESPVAVAVGLCAALSLVALALEVLQASTDSERSAERVRAPILYPVLCERRIARSCVSVSAEAEAIERSRDMVVWETIEQFSGAGR